jgi:prepilin-type N-terminal cleavage/methylation domain-containing protein
MIASNRGFTLIELLVVVAVLGIVTAIGVVSYSGYQESAKKKSAENTMLQISLAETEYYSDNSEFYVTKEGSTCTPNETSNASITTNLFVTVSKDIDFDICINKFGGASNDYQLRAVSTTNAACTISWNNVNQQFTRASPGCD